MPKPDDKPKPPTPGKAKRRKIEFTSGDLRDSGALTERLMSQGISVDRIPQGNGQVLIKAVGEPDKPGKSSLAKDLAKGLRSVKIKSDVTE
jgi:hypothetical protein